MAHVDNHPHAFIDENNIVIQVSAFQEQDHDTPFLEELRVFHNSKQVVCCCVFGLPNVGATWTGTEFIPASPYPSWVWNYELKKWEAPIPMPLDYENHEAFFIWFEPNKTWVKMMFDTQTDTFVEIP